MEHLRLALSLDEITERIPNKYEFIVLASRYARLFARETTEEGRIPEKKPIFMGVERVMEGPVEYSKGGSWTRIEAPSGDNR